MKEFNDGTLDPQKQASIRLGDVYEVARRIGRLGVREVEIFPEDLAITFYDHRFKVQAELEIEPWSGIEPGWFWYAKLDSPLSFSFGPMADGKWVVCCPTPRQVVRMYRQDIWWERRPPKRKINKRSKRS